MPSSSAAVAVHATAAGVATTNDCQKVATSIVPCTHQRSGTLSRSWWLGVGRSLTRAQPTIPGLRTRHTGRVRAVPDAPHPGQHRVRPARRRRPARPRPAAARRTPHPGDAGADPDVHRRPHPRPGERALVPTGIALALPEGYVALVHPRSGLAARHGLSIVNTPGHDRRRLPRRGQGAAGQPRPRHAGRAPARRPDRAGWSCSASSARSSSRSTPCRGRSGAPGVTVQPEVDEPSSRRVSRIPAARAVARSQETY